MSELFDVCIYLTIRCKDGEQTLLRQLSLPFAPYPRLELSFDEKDEDWVRLDRVEYNTCAEAFWCDVTNEFGDDCCCTPEDGCCMVAKWVEHFKGYGWEEDGGPSLIKDHPYMKHHDWQWGNEEEVTA